jgi:hypothetical protein
MHEDVDRPDPDLKITVGDDAEPNLNTYCDGSSGQKSGWFQCSDDLMGRHFSLLQSGNITNLKEVLAFAEARVSWSNISVVVSDLLPGS